MDFQSQIFDNNNVRFGYEMVDIANEAPSWL